MKIAANEIFKSSTARNFIDYKIRRYDVIIQFPLSVISQIQIICTKTIVIRIFTNITYYISHERICARELLRRGNRGERRGRGWNREFRDVVDACSERGYETEEDEGRRGSAPNRVNINSTVGRHINANPLIYLPFARRRPASAAIILSNGSGGTPSSPHPLAVRTLRVSGVHVHADACSTYVRM